MAKDNRIAVRSHQQELEWLRNLGQGNIAQGVKSLIERDKDGNAKRNERCFPKNKRS
jgi:hypothetical protein